MESNIKLTPVILTNGLCYQLTISRRNSNVLAQSQYILISAKELDTIIELKKENWCETTIEEKEQT